MDRSLPLAQTRAFLARTLPPAPATLLEVGCGDGALAASLAADGYLVTAIDIDPVAVAATRARGVSAECADFRDWGGGPYQAILFARSLHHIHPLARALARAKLLLRPDGRLIAEEFAHERCDDATAEWHFPRLDAFRAGAGAPPHAHDPGPGFGGAPLERWRALYAHEPPLHSGAEMQREIAERFKLVLAEPAPYLYRLIGDLRLPDAGPVEATFAEEQRAIENGRIQPIGLRLVAELDGKKRSG